MIKSLSRLAFATGLFVVIGCGKSEPEAAKATPEPDAAAKESMKKAMEGGGGPAEVQKRLQGGQNQPN